MVAKNAKLKDARKIEQSPSKGNQNPIEDTSKSERMLRKDSLRMDTNISHLQITKASENHSNCRSKSPQIACLRRNTIESNEASVINSFVKPVVQIQAKKCSGLSTVIGRETEYETIKKQVISFTDHKSSSILYITGVPGSGKTYTTTNLLKFMGLSYCYVNCSKLKTKLAVYAAILEGFPCSENNTSLQSLRLHCTNCCESHILIIDEIDFILNKRETFLYNLFELPFIENSKILIIAISNTLGCLSTKVESRIGKNRLEFRPYTAKQLKSVVESELQGADINEKSIELITRRIAASTGDIRKVNEIIQKVGHCDLSDVNSFLKKFSTPLINRFVSSFGFYQKMLVFLHKQSTKSILDWFDSHKSFCAMKNYCPLDFADFQSVVKDLVEFDVYKIRKDGITAVCNYMEEELEAAGKEDKDFTEFSKTQRF